MLAKRLIFPICLIATLAIQAQDSLLLHDYTFMKQSDPWLTSPNAAALTRFSYQNMSQAGLSFSGEKGGFTNYFASDDATLLNANVESFYRYNQHTIFYGNLSYENYSGRHMAGSAFINPERKPFDLIEDSLTNEGTKHRDTYNLTGGFGCSVVDGFSIGGKIAFTAANMAKYKDLRHQNKLMDLQLSAGIYADITPWLNLGAYYLHHRNTESITFGTYGTSDKVYKTLVSYANFTGHVEQFGQEGYTDKSREMPLVTNNNGIGIQFSISNSQLALYATYAFTYGWGYYGNKSPYTITYSEHDSNKHTLQLQAAYSNCKSKHVIDFNMDFETLQNNATTYREQKNATGATFYDYFTPTKNADKQWKNASLVYTLHLGIRETIPSWTLQTGINWMTRKQTAYVYPYYRRQDISNYSPFVSVCRNIVTAKGVWSVTLNGSYLKGSGSPFEDNTFQTPSDKQVTPPSMEAYLYREYQYLTASQFSLGGNVKYAFIFPNTHLKTYTQISLAHQKANETYSYSNGRNHTQAILAIGCEF